MNSKSEGHEVSCPSPKLCFTPASRPWPATFPPTITVMFWLETETFIRVYAWPLWFVCCGSVVINVIYSTVENPRRLTDQKPEEKHVGGHWQFVQRGKILFPAESPSLGLWTQATSQSSSVVEKWERILHKHEPDWQKWEAKGDFPRLPPCAVGAVFAIHDPHLPTS